MKPRFSALLAVLAVCTVTAMAQQPVPLETMQAALNFRAELAAAVGRNAESAENALRRLQNKESASGLSYEKDADLAHAALDIGHRLLAMRQLEAAEVFFHAAEENFERAANRTSLGQPREKAQYLQKLAFVRGNFLNKIAQAKLDIEEAIRLQPNDKSLAESRALLARGRGEHFKDSRKN